eukprot:454567_1
MKNNNNHKKLAAANIIEFAKLVIRSRFFDSSMIQQFKKASSGSGSNKKSFDSTAFTVHRTTWCLQCYPAGDKYADNGMSSLYLKILELPDGGGHLIMNMKVRIQFECLIFNMKAKNSFTFMRIRCQKCTSGSAAHSTRFN